MQSHFNSQTLAEIFRDLYLAERTGVLMLHGDEVTSRVFFERGLIHYADSTDSNGSLGDALIEAGHLSAGALNEAQQEISSPEQLPRTLLNRELVDKSRLEQIVGTMTEEVVRSSFRWLGGSATFDDSNDIEGLFDSDVLTTFETILGGIFTMREFEPIREAMLGMDNRLRVRSPTPIPLEKLTLSPAHGFILSRVDGASTVKNVVSILPEAEEELASRFLFGMVVMGILEYNPPLGEGPFRVANILRDHEDRRALESMQEQTIRQAYEHMRGQNPYEVLAVPSSPSRQAVERAYEEAKALFSRERILPRVREKFRSELAVIESRLIEAYLTLTQPDRRQREAATQMLKPQAPGDVTTADDLLVRVEMDKTRSKLEQEESTRVAEQYFGKARQAIREGDYHNAIQYGKLAISYNETDPRYYFMLADCQARNPGARWQHQAEQNYSRATQLDPWNTEYWMTLGRFYKKRGLHLRARKQFEEALKLVPGHEEATRELATLR